MEAKALSFTHRTKVIADGTGRKNNARSRRWMNSSARTPKASLSFCCERRRELLGAADKTANLAR